MSPTPGYTPLEQAGSSEPVAPISSLWQDLTRRFRESAGVAPPVSEFISKPAPAARPHAHRGGALRAAAVGAAASCSWTVHGGLDLAAAGRTVLNGPGELEERCKLRHTDLEAAKRACEATTWCGGVTQDNGLVCDDDSRPRFELRSDEPNGQHPAVVSSWVLVRSPTCVAKGEGKGKAAGKAKGGGGGGGGGFFRIKISILGFFIVSHLNSIDLMCL